MYEETQPKFVIEDNRLVLGMVTKHKELVSSPLLVKGGGWFYLDEPNKTITLYGCSSDFGTANLQDITQAVKARHCDYTWEEGYFNDYTFRYAWYTSLEMAMEHATLIEV